MGEPIETDSGRALRIIVDRDLADQIDAWRRAQTRIPSTPDTVRRLITRALSDCARQHTAA
jgi:hypothetical protein